MRRTTIRKAIIPAAGLGTRFLPATKALPKEMLPIVDKPTIQYIVEEAMSAGIEDIIIVTGRNKRAIEDHFDKSIELELSLAENQKMEMLEMVQEVSKMVDIHYIRQKQPLGLGHAVWCARKFIGDEPFAVLLGDDIVETKPNCLAEMIRLYEEHRTSVIGVQNVPLEEVSRYGIINPIELGDRTYIRDLVEKPEVKQAPSTMAVMGRYIIEPEVFSLLENQTPGKGGEIQLTDALRELNQSKQMLAYLIQGQRYDIGDKLGYLKATIEFALKKPELATELRIYLETLVREQLGQPHAARNGDE